MGMARNVVGHKLNGENGFKLIMHNILLAILRVYDPLLFSTMACICSIKQHCLHLQVSYSYGSYQQHNYHNTLAHNRSVTVLVTRADRLSAVATVK